jgi:hypothetical protein
VAWTGSMPPPNHAASVGPSATANLSGYEGGGEGRPPLSGPDRATRC